MYIHGSGHVKGTANRPFCTLCTLSPMSDLGVGTAARLERAYKMDDLQCPLRGPSTKRNQLVAPGCSSSSAHTKCVEEVARMDWTQVQNTLLAS